MAEMKWYRPPREFFNPPLIPGTPYYRWFMAELRMTDEERKKRRDDQERDDMLRRIFG